MRKLLTKRNIIILVVILAVAGGVWYRNYSKSKTQSQGKMVTVSRGEVKEIITVAGEVKADKEAILNFQTAGKVAYIGVKVGDGVTRGQFLIGIDTGELDVAARTAYHQYLAAEANAKAVEDSAKNHDTNENFDLRKTRVSAQTTRDMAYDAWQQSIKNIQKAKLYAPFDGYVTAVSVNTLGDTAGVTDGVTVVAPEGLHFEGEVDETDVTKIQTGQKVEIKLDAFGDKVFEGTITNIGFASRLSSTGANVYPIQISFGSEDEKNLRLGMNGDADILLAVAENTLILPFEAVVDGEVVPANAPETKKKVTVGLEGENEVEIREGLSEGDKVIVK